MALTILLARFSALSILILSLFFSTLVFSRETFEFDLGQKINILSDKAFRKTSENEFEAIGNVVITHLRNSIYGEKAKINFTTGDAEVIGNVRYIAPEMTLYGTKLKYNFLTRQIDLDNARILSDNYVITGKKILQTNPGFIYAEDADYTTCRDCPESWTVYGKSVVIEIGKYINIRNAYIKVNGVVAMYFPYIVFPIKQRRETGLLFPLIGFSSKEGFRYQQPFFWAIDDYKDATFVPSTFGNRGLGGEFQYRQNFREKTWLEMNSLQLNDKIYAPYKDNKEKSGDQYYRHFSDIEFHSTYKHYFNNHIYFTNTSDLDTTRDLDFFSREKMRGTEIGGGGFLEGRSDYFSLITEGYFNKNMFIDNPREFDNRYVQMLPKISLSSVPYNIFHSQYPFAKNISIGLNSDFTIFKQNKFSEAGTIRNARRLNLAPYVNWQLGNIGPVFFSHQLKLDYQNYYFPNEVDKRFKKQGLIFETEAKFELEKIFGLAYIEEKPAEQLSDVSLKKTQSTIGTLPSLNNSSESVTQIKSNSYRHSQEVKMKHYYLSNQQLSGNPRFKNQIESDIGQFDYIDAIRAREHVTNQVTAQDSMPLSNTIEFQWNNKLIQKSALVFDPYVDGRYLKDNFSYANIAYFDLSQGLDLNIKPDGNKIQSIGLMDRLTRLYINTGISLSKTSLSVQEFYFHKTSEHKFSSSASYAFDRATLGGRFTYNSFNSSNTPITKTVGYNVLLSPNDLVSLKYSADYDFQTKLFTQTDYSILYSPLNNCWKIEFSYGRNLIDSKFGLVFYINYNENNYTSINVR
ncbi:MAG: LPS-assembly protein LptD [Bacteriovorax sp.]|nr:LPS-assembly protein LptD [Bacteriovorax sp.]